MKILIKVTTQKIKRGEGASYLCRRNTRNEFQKIINLTDKDPAHKESMLKIDQNLCRYKDIYPYKDDKIVLNINYNEHEDINASWMHIFELHSFIATQGPNDITIDDFWTMCFKYNVGAIIMLCKEFEDNKKKCSNYWDKTFKSAIFEIKECTILPN